MAPLLPEGPLLRAPSTQQRSAARGPAGSLPPRGRGELPTEPARRSGRSLGLEWRCPSAADAPLPAAGPPREKERPGPGAPLRARAPLPTVLSLPSETREGEAGASADKSSYCDLLSRSGTQPAAYRRRWWGERVSGCGGGGGGK